VVMAERLPKSQALTGAIPKVRSKRVPDRGFFLMVWEHPRLNEHFDLVKTRSR
jgi:hypothetical protein